MFTDYITLLLTNMAAGLVVLAAFFLWGLGREGERSWAPALAIVGLVAVIGGLHMALTWPIPKLPSVNLAWANAAYGEMSVLLGVAFLGAAAAVAKGWSLAGVALYGCLAGLAAAVLGVRIMVLGLSQAPILTGVGFLATGLAGTLSLLIVLRPGVRALRVLGALDLAASAAIWFLTAFLAYWGHLARWSTT